MNCHTNGFGNNRINMEIDKKLITIFTPTYNRGYILTELYESLKRQSCNDFIWLIVDDGSSDDTRVLVNSWMLSEEVTIQYFWQENQGKARRIIRG